MEKENCFSQYKGKQKKEEEEIGVIYQHWTNYGTIWMINSLWDSLSHDILESKSGSLQKSLIIHGRQIHQRLVHSSLDVTQDQEVPKKLISVR